jgi:hypothetical protein
MHKAAQLAALLDGVDDAEGEETILAWSERALSHVLIDEAMCIMHSDGSVNVIEHKGNGVMAVEVISAENILKVLKHYRPFEEVFPTQGHNPN